MKRLQMRVTGLFFHPIKSCRATSCQRLEIGPSGPLHDRAFMVVERGDTKQFITQRTHPRLALIEPTITADHLCVRAEGMSTIMRGRDHWGEGRRVPTMVHKQACVGVDQGDRIAEWFSDFLHHHVRLLWMPEDHRREPNPKRLPPGVRAGLKYADGYPLLLTSEASLHAVNMALPDDLPPFAMDQFRPNIVVDGEEAWAEEMWLRFLCGDLRLHGVKPCDRCAIIMNNQQTGVRTARLLKALLEIHSGLRGETSVPLFGMNLIPATEGVIHVNDLITDIELGPRPEL